VAYKGNERSKAMPKELSKSSLKTWLRYWAKYKGKILEGKELQAYKQIWRLIEGKPDPKDIVTCPYCHKIYTKQSGKKVSKKFVEKWIDIMKNYNDWSMESRVKEMFQEAGVEIEE